MNMFNTAVLLLPDIPMFEGCRKAALDRAVTVSLYGSFTRDHLCRTPYPSSNIIWSVDLRYFRHNQTIEPFQLLVTIQMIITIGLS